MEQVVINGDCLEKMRELDSNSVDSIVTDPPYGLKFMNKKWDHSVPSVDIWREALRVLKPGGHLLSFGGTRTYHRMVVAIEDAGFEIRDQIQWLYGSGFPKSHDISKGIDKAAGAEREIVGVKSYADGSKARQTSKYAENSYHASVTRGTENAVTIPTTDLAKQWQGWGTALKPANEPIVLARKPLDGTVAQNVAKWGVGGLNIDESRLDTKGRKVGCVTPSDEPTGSGNSLVGSSRSRTMEYDIKNQGRWPANLLLDEIAAELLDDCWMSRVGYLKARLVEQGENPAVIIMHRPLRSV